VKVTKKHLFRYGKYFVFFLVAAFLMLVLAYAGFAYATKEKVLPAINLLNQNISGLSKDELREVIDQQAQKKSLEKVVLVDADSRDAKTFREIGLGIDQSKTLDVTFLSGKLWGKYPSPKYFFESFFGGMTIRPVLSWNNDDYKKLSDSLDSKKVAAESPKIQPTDSSIDIIDGKSGSNVDLKSLKQDSENCFVSGCLASITLTRLPVRPNFVAADVEPFKDQLVKIVQSKITVTYNNKKIYPTKDELAGFIDLERTVLEQKLVLSDDGIKNYLNTKAQKIDTKGKNKVISAYDNSVISEGSEGLQVDIDKSTVSIKDAISNSKQTVALTISTTPIKEEVQQPGFTPGKYPGKYIEVNLTEQNLYLMNGTNIEGTYRVSTGKWSMPTPVGEYTINNKDPRAYSQEYNLYMPWWMAFIGSKYGIHELPEWPDGRKEGEGHLGTPVSHGCIRLGVGAAETVYNWADVGTPVYVHK
jgi:lipoprotein-anchoring transpeptidase ErfK/SrfK